MPSQSTVRRRYSAWNAVGVSSMSSTSTTPTSKERREEGRVVVLEQADDEVVGDLARQLGEDVRVREQPGAGEVGLQARHDGVEPGERPSEADGELGQRDERGLVVAASMASRARRSRHEHADAAAELVQSGELDGVR